MDKATFPHISSIPLPEWWENDAPSIWTFFSLEKEV